MNSIIVLGAGPAGLAAGAAIARAGLPVTLVDPEPEARWKPTYGMWLRQARALGIAHLLERTWSCPLVLRQGHVKRLGFEYAKVDGDAVRDELLLTFRRHGGTLRGGRATAVYPDRLGVAVQLADEEWLEGRLCIDATGRGHFLRRNERACAEQTAFGLLLEVERHPWADDEMVLMDFRGPRVDGVPTFLYAMPMAPNRVFVEQTVLASFPPVRPERLRFALQEQLDGLGLVVRQEVASEHVRIPMDLPVPELTQPVVGFGMAASFVHPATGYTLGRTLGSAPALASCIAAGMAADLPPERMARLAWKTLWPAARTQTHALSVLGLEVLLSLDADELATFLTGFFDLPAEVWYAYFSCQTGPLTRAAAMALLGRHLPARLTLRAARLSASALSGQVRASLEALA